MLYGWSGEGNRDLREYLTKSGFSVIDTEIKSNWNPTDELLDTAKEIAKKLID